MRYRFGQFDLVEDTRELLVHGEPRQIEPQVFDLICCLLRQRERVVTRDDLVRDVWGGRIVSDSAISARINAARTALDDNGERQELIRTIPRRGFRFVGEVVELPSRESDRVPALPKAGDRGNRQRVAYCRSRDGTGIAYAVSGDGYPVLRAGHWLTHLEHDWNSPIWRPILDTLDSRHKVVRYDQRGNGLSDWNVEDFSLDRFVEDLGAVADAAGLDRFALYGSSQGAPVAIAYAYRHPERVSHLILHGGYLKGRLVRDLQSDREEGSALLTLIRHGWGKPDSALVNAFAAMFIPDGNDEQMRSLAELQRRTTTPENAARIRASVDEFDVSDLADSITAPTLVIHARGDAVQPLEQGKLLAAAIPHAQFLMLESRNHVILPQENAWKVLFDEIERFVD